MKIIFESFSVDGVSTSFNNPHGWTQGEMNTYWGELRDSFAAAFTIRLMAMSSSMLRDSFDSEIKKLRGEA